MADFHPKSPAGVVLTIDDVCQWKADLLQLDLESEQIELRRSDLKRKLEAAALFLDVDAVEPAKPAKAVAAETSTTQTQAVKQSAKPKMRRRQNSGLPTWADVVWRGVQTAPMGLSYAEMRQFASASELGEKLRNSDKGYHNAISRLAKDKKIVREHGRLFTPEAYERFMREVAEGRASTVVPMPLAHSPMGEAILKIVHKRQGLNGKGVIGELRKDPEFNATLTPHETGAYNIIARLVKRRQLLRRDDGGLIVGPDFPKDLIEQEPAPSNVSSLFDAMKRNSDAV